MGGSIAAPTQTHAPAVGPSSASALAGTEFPASTATATATPHLTQQAQQRSSHQILQDQHNAAPKQQQQQHLITSPSDLTAKPHLAQQLQTVMNTGAGPVSHATADQGK